MASTSSPFRTPNTLIALRAVTCIKTWQSLPKGIRAFVQYLACLVTCSSAMFLSLSYLALYMFFVFAVHFQVVLLEIIVLQRAVVSHLHASRVTLQPSRAPHDDTKISCNALPAFRSLRLLAVASSRNYLDQRLLYSLRCILSVVDRCRPLISAPWQGTPPKSSLTTLAEIVETFLLNLCLCVA